MVINDDFTIGFVVYIGGLPDIINFEGSSILLIKDLACINLSGNCNSEVKLIV